jgi:glutamine synthetase
MQIYKYVVRSVAHSYGKSATFLPKPMAFEPGSGLQVQQALWRTDRPLFAGQGYGDVSDECLHYIGGVLHHARALNAFTNPTTNSYRRLAPGGGAPRQLAYAALNRSAAIRLPFADQPADKRVEARFPDPAANPYLAFAALLMAGIDGAADRSRGHGPQSHDLRQRSKTSHACLDAEEALMRSKDRGSPEGEVFTDELIGTSRPSARRWPRSNGFLTRWVPALLFRVTLKA